MNINEIITEQVVQEIKRPSLLSHAKKILLSNGYKELGSGYYATVLGKPETPHVLKLFDFSDKGYLEFVALSMSVDNPHFPKIKGKPFRVTSSYYAVRLERLSHFMGSEDPKKYGFEYAYQLLNILATVIYNSQKGYPKSKLLDDNDIEQLSRYFEVIPFSTIPDAIKGMAPEEVVKYKFKQLCEKHPDLIEACWLIGRYVHPSRSIDLHEGNIMMRGDILVITDPVSFGVYK